MRLIDADALIECLQTWKTAAVSEGLPINERFAMAMIAQVNLMPTIEPERKKGKWIEHECGYWTFVNKDGERDGWIPDYECSECGSRGWKHAYNMNFCPNCGADMREEGDLE